jgi:hypothetical protein
MLGITEEEYAYFVSEARKFEGFAPGEPVAFEPFSTTAFIVQLVIGIVLTAAAALLAPTTKVKPPPRLETRQVDGQDIVTNTRFTPKAGFDGQQNIVELGSIVPVVYANREKIGDKYYGGVRVNTNLLWAQLISSGGSQMMRAVFMICEGAIGNIDRRQFAFGNNLIGGYELETTNNTAGRVSIYYQNGSRVTNCRLRSEDHIAGRQPQFDDGNAQAFGGPDVFAVRGVGNSWTTDFCYTFKPSSQTQFGLYQPIGNGMSYRPNPVTRPIAQVFFTRENADGDQKVNCPRDLQSLAQQEKNQAIFMSYANVTGGSFVPVGGIVTYVNRRDTDGEFEFDRLSSDGPDAIVGTLDVAQAMAARQRSYDDSIIVGELYKLGTALLICIERSPDETYVSDADNDPIGGGTTITARFRAVKAGSYLSTTHAGPPSPNNVLWNATNMSHLFRVAIATFIVDRPAQVIEIGLRHALGLRINGLCNFREILSQNKVDIASCYNWENQVIQAGDVLNTQNYTSGTYTGAEERYAFFRVGFRLAGTSGDFTYLEPCFGCRSVTQQPVYTYLRLEMPSEERWEFQMLPLSGWEIRNNRASGPLWVIDYRQRQVSVNAGSGVVARFNGTLVQRVSDAFRLYQTVPKNDLTPENSRSPEIPYAENFPGEANSMADNWGKLAEMFVYEEITASTQSPEFEVVYVNVITKNKTVPTYESISTIGVNIKAGSEFRQLTQFSAYVQSGVNQFHHFPEVLYDLFTNIRYGVGIFLSQEQIDKPSFDDMTAWTRARRYFFDGAITERVNIRSWAVEVARSFLLDMVVRNGKFALQPSVWFDRPEPITGLFTAGNILEDSFELTYFDPEERIPPRVSIRWREERTTSDVGASGLFPTLREVTVEEVGVENGAPLEQLDISDYCTSQEQAIDYGKYICRVRRLVTHSVSFKTLPNQAALDLGRSFLLGYETTAYEQPNNGVITADGTVTSWPPLADGSYPVLLWTGGAAAVQESTIVISGGKSAPAGAVFCLRSGGTETIAYRVQSLSFDEDGNLEVTATHFPLEANGFSQIVTDWDSGFNIEGEI